MAVLLNSSHNPDGAVNNPYNLAASRRLFATTFILSEPGVVVHVATYSVNSRLEFYKNIKNPCFYMIVIRYAHIYISLQYINTWYQKKRDSDRHIKYKITIHTIWSCNSDS